MHNPGVPCFIHDVQTDFHRKQVEITAKLRIGQSDDEDTPMSDAPSINTLEIGDPSTPNGKHNALPQVTFTPSKPSSPHKPSRPEDESVMEPSDPDPFLSVDMDNMRARSRRGSYAPPVPESPSQEGHSGPRTRSRTQTPLPSPSALKTTHAVTPPDSNFRPKRPRTISRKASQLSKGRFPDVILTTIFSFLDIYQLMRLRLVSLHWSKLLTTSPHICQHLDLSTYNRKVTNAALTTSICPFVGRRARTVDISNCFHITDEGFSSLTAICGPSVRSWKMKSVWDITANTILEMANTAKLLEEIDLSNCRKVSDNLLARIVGWVVAEPQMPVRYPVRNGIVQLPPPVGTVVGCPQLKRLTLSYCKHVTDRSMAHLAVHAHTRLQSIDLTRCTTITDGGFQHWSIYKFSKLERLILADCTYLTDNAIVYLTNAAKGLKELDLVRPFFDSSRDHDRGANTRQSPSAAPSRTQRPKCSPSAAPPSAHSNSPSAAPPSPTAPSAPSVCTYYIFDSSPSAAVYASRA